MSAADTPIGGDKCSTCGAPLRVGAKFCRDCGAAQAAPGPPPAITPQPESAGRSGPKPDFMASLRSSFQTLPIPAVLKSPMAVVGMVMATLLVLTITVVVLLNRPREPKVEPVQQYATRLTRVRDKPTAISSVILGDIRRGDAVVGTWVVGEDGQTPWLKIKWGQGGEAYAWGNNLSPDTPPPIIRETTESRSVLAPTALYAAPRVDAAQIDDLPTGAKVELAGELAAGWYEVARKQGGVGYIQATAFVRPAPANEVATPAGAVVAPANDHSTAVGMRPDAQICSRLSPGVAYEFHSIGWNLNEGWFASDTSRPKDAVRYANANSYDVTVQYYFVPPNAPCPP